MLTWYDVLGVLPGASTEQVRSAYESRARLLNARMFTGVPLKVLKAADVARAAADQAWHVLRDPSARQQHDEEIGVRRIGEGLDAPLSIPSGPGGAPSGRWLSADIVTAGLADLMTSHPAPRRQVVMPELRGLFASSVLRITGGLGLHLQKGSAHRPSNAGHGVLCSRSVTGRGLTELLPAAS